MASELPAIERPNGRSYRPRKLVAHAVADYDDDVIGVVVFGTHTRSARVTALAQAAVDLWADSGCVPVDPIAVWWRDGFCLGRRTWIDDDERGRAGLWYREIVERPRGQIGDSAARDEP